MRGQILLAGIVEDVGISVCADRLKRVARFTTGIAIVDDDRDAAMGRDMPA